MEIFLFNRIIGVSSKQYILFDLQERLPQTPYSGKRDGNGCAKSISSKYIS
jgi:hypothetical protein